MRTVICLSVLVVVLHAEAVTAQPSTISCPRVLCLRDPDGNPLPCKNQCRTNRDCLRGGQCCFQCGCSFCFGGFVPPPKETCKSKTCPKGQICRELPSPRCEKPGTCPDTSNIVSICVVDPLNPGCGTDSDCKGVSKCCRYGCQRSCLVPLKYD